MDTPTSAAPFVPATRSLAARAPLVLVGGQPGDREDRAGPPFVGPAGRLPDRAFEEAGIARGQVYVTNAVKHFKWTLRGTRRIHKKPHEREIAACLPWLPAGLEALRPKVVAALGVTAARALCGRAVTLRDARGGSSRPSRRAPR